jgi:LacI family transcriptional regulator
MTGRVTMADVAREAGVSLMTVSRVVNSKAEVGVATRQRVQEVIERLGYRPSGIARGLATKRTGTIGLVLPDVANPFFAEVAQGAEHVAYAEGFNVFLCNTKEDAGREAAVLRSLEEKRVDGLVLCSSRLDEASLGEAVSRFSSVVMVNRRLEQDQVHSVLLDDETGGRQATDHLLQSGHRAVGMLAGPAISHSGIERAAGYRAALTTAGLPYLPEYVRPCPPMVEGGYDGVLGLLADHPGLTAVFCYNDLVAVGALRACADLGRQVPTDVAVVGYDDIPLAALVTPPLTTCRVPRYELGVEAVQLLLDRIRRSQEMPAEIILKPELVVRASAPGCDPEGT